MNYQTITVTPVSPTIGAEIGGVDLTAPVPEAQQRELLAAFTQYQVIFLRDQHLGLDDLERAGRIFGDLFGHVGLKSNSKPTENPFVRRYHFDEHSKNVQERQFHSDQSCADAPPSVSVLYNHTIPPDGAGDTLYINMYAAYDALSDPMKQYLRGLTAVHDGGRNYGEGSPVASHPVIVRHPVSGKNAIFVNPGFTTGINGLPERESRHILQFLFDHCTTRFEWSCRFHWQPHSIAFWDNRCTLHKVISDFWPHVRSGYRVYVKSAEGRMIAG